MDKKENDALATIWRKLWYLENTVSNFRIAKDVRLFSLRHFLLGQFDEENRKGLAGQSRIWRLWMWASVAFAFLSLLQEVLLYVVLITNVLEGRILIGDFLMYANGIHTFVNAVSGLMRNITDISRHSKYVADYREFLDLPGSGAAGLPGDWSSPARLRNGCCGNLLGRAFARSRRKGDAR